MYPFSEHLFQSHKTMILAQTGELYIYIINFATQKAFITVLCTEPQSTV
jgi:hypothetical protein